ncbi:MAG: hypothetical protein FJ147_13780 [Deltaproteobacteria bacterium]|nr:hypothetical protein [Deltaproteobacteria bacterium]
MAQTPQTLAVRMGLRYVKGLSQKDGEHIVTMRRGKSFSSLEDWMRRIALSQTSLSTLAATGALASLGGNRRTALWQVQAATHVTSDSLALPSREILPSFPSLTQGEEIRWDYQHTAHSVRGHPLQVLRAELDTQGLPPARVVQQLPNGARVRYAGLVISRQRPSTSKGVVFMTLEDETGFVNVVLWATVYTRYKVIAKTATLLGVTGRLQSQDGVVHLVAEQLWIPHVRQLPVRVTSRDFH